MSVSLSGYHHSSDWMEAIVWSAWPCQWLYLNIAYHRFLRVIDAGSGCGSVGRAVASDTRDLRFKPHHQKSFIHQIIYQLYHRKDQNKWKRVREWPILRKKSNWCLLVLRENNLLLLITVSWCFAPPMSNNIVCFLREGPTFSFFSLCLQVFFTCKIYSVCGKCFLNSPTYIGSPSGL